MKCLKVFNKITFKPCNIVNILDKYHLSSYMNYQSHCLPPTVSKSFTLRMKLSSGCRRSSRVDRLTICSKCGFLCRGTSRAGNRSPTRPRNTGTSSVTILGILKSLSDRISTWDRGQRTLGLRMRGTFQK